MLPAEIDFEVYSEVGFYFDPIKKAFKPLPPKGKKGLKASGAFTYSEHPSTEILCLAYDLRKGEGVKIWRPLKKDPYPWDLIAHVRNGGSVSAFNSFFELCIWNNTLHKRNPSIWPFLQIEQTYDVAARANAMGLPQKLEACAQVLGLEVLKDSKGKELINKLCMPRVRSKNKPYDRVLPCHDPQAYEDLYSYNIQDVKTSIAVSDKLPWLSPFERRVFIADQKINYRGVYLETEAVKKIESLLYFQLDLLNEELFELTEGQVKTGNQVEKISTYLRSKCNVPISSLNKETIAYYKNNFKLSEKAKRILEIREESSSTSTKKVFAMLRSVSSLGRLHGLFTYYGANRTGRWTGGGCQPQNLPFDGGKIFQCQKCSNFKRKFSPCFCTPVPQALKETDWNAAAANFAIEKLKQINGHSYCNRDFYEDHGPILKTVSGSLRGLFRSAPGKKFYCSDYRAIEAVVLAAISGEDWRLEVFKTHGKIYEMSASKITGIPFEEFMSYKKKHGKNHPKRNAVGKVAELASGYQGGPDAWKRFGADKHLSEDEILANVKKWRKESPMIVNFWYGVQRAAISAVKNPGQDFSYRDITYFSLNGSLFCQLPSGRCLVYQSPFITKQTDKFGRLRDALNFWGWVSVNGRKQWVTVSTFGGKLTENIVQAVSRDILAFALVNLEEAGWNTVLHVHDEIICEELIRDNKKIEDMEKIMSDMPPWAKGWPVIAHEGWIGDRFKKG